jgi:hypothetical protein
MQWLQYPNLSNVGNLNNVSRAANLKQGDALSPLLLKFALEYAFKRFQVNQDGFLIMLMMFIYWGEVYTLGGKKQAL